MTQVSSPVFAIPTTQISIRSVGSRTVESTRYSFTIAVDGVHLQTFSARTSSLRRRITALVGDDGPAFPVDRQAPGAPRADRAEHLAAYLNAVFNMPQDEGRILLGLNDALHLEAFTRISLEKVAARRKIATKLKVKSIARKESAQPVAAIDKQPFMANEESACKASLISHSDTTNRSSTTRHFIRNYMNLSGGGAVSNTHYTARKASEGPSLVEFIDNFF